SRASISSNHFAVVGRSAISGALPDSRRTDTCVPGRRATAPDRARAERDDRPWRSPCRRQCATASATGSPIVLAAARRYRWQAGELVHAVAPPATTGQGNAASRRRPGATAFASERSRPRPGKSDRPLQAPAERARCRSAQQHDPCRCRAQTGRTPDPPASTPAQTRTARVAPAGSRTAARRATRATFATPADATPPHTRHSLAIALSVRVQLCDNRARHRKSSPSRPARSSARPPSNEPDRGSPPGGANPAPRGVDPAARRRAPGRNPSCPQSPRPLNLLIPNADEAIGQSLDRCQRASAIGLLRGRAGDSFSGLLVYLRGLPVEGSRGPGMQCHDELLGALQDASPLLARVLQ